MIFTNLIIAKLLDRCKSILYKEIFHFSALERIQNEITLLSCTLIAGDLTTRIIVVGNLLHEDSLMMRPQRAIDEKEIEGVFLKIPLLDDAGVCAWPGKYPDSVAIDREKRKSGDYIAWMREYLLKIVAEADQLVPSQWIHHYSQLPIHDPEHTPYRYAIMAVDLAISQKQTADYTAIVSAVVYGRANELRIYVLPFPVNQRLRFPQQIEAIKRVYHEMSTQYRTTQILVENNGYQQAIVDQLEKEQLPVQGIATRGQDKRARLAVVTPHIKNGIILFPKKGTETLIAQLVGFGAERHDDLVDACTMLLSHCEKDYSPHPPIDIKLPIPGPSRWEQFHNEFHVERITMDTVF